MIQIKHRFLPLIVTAVMIFGYFGYTALEVTAKSNNASDFWSSELAEENYATVDTVTTQSLLDALDSSVAINEEYMNVILSAGENYSQLPTSEKNKLTADSVRLLSKEYYRASDEIIRQAEMLPSTGDIYIHGDESLDLGYEMEKVLKLTSYSLRFPRDIKDKLPTESLNRLEDKLTRVAYADTDTLDNAQIIDDFSTEYGTEQVLTAIQAYQSLGDNIDLVNSNSVEKLSGAISNMVYSEVALTNKNFCLLFDIEDLSKETAPTLLVQPEKLNLTQKQLNLYKGALTANTSLSNVSKLNVTISGEKVDSSPIPIAVTLSISSSLAERHPYVISYYNQAPTILYDTDNVDNTITVMMTEFGEYAIAYDISADDITSSKEVTIPLQGKPSTPTNTGGAIENSNLSSSNTSSTSNNSSKTDNSSSDISSVASKINDEKAVISSATDTSSDSSSTISSSADSSSDKASVSSATKKDSSSGTIQEEEGKAKPVLANMPVKIEHNNRMVLIVVLIGAVVLLVGILVIMLMPKKGNTKDK